ncbi:hypothetical protein GCM10020001_027780 [Nonomuraea salmonea]
MANRWSEAASTHLPSWAIPIGITSYLVLSIASSTLPAPHQGNGVLGIATSENDGDAWLAHGVRIYRGVPVTASRARRIQVIRYLRGNPRLQAGKESDPCGAGQGQPVRRQANRRIEHMSELWLIVR